VAHRRRPLANAFALNRAVLVEVVGGLKASSLSLLLDGVHNLSDEIALGFLVLAYTIQNGLSGRLLRSANLFNSVGLVAVCAVLVWQALERLAQPAAVIGVIPIAAGLFGAAGNWGVARVLREPARDDAAIRLAYVHNLGDTLLSLAPVAAGFLVLITGRALFDPLIALGVAGVILVATARSVLGSHRELIWPENVACAHGESSSD
jgi:cobalt-zinc-cadmium efflux system protein